MSNTRILDPERTQLSVPTVVKTVDRELNDRYFELSAYFTNNYHSLTEAERKELDIQLSNIANTISSIRR